MWEYQKCIGTNVAGIILQADILENIVVGP
jgi:hypothetical protein